ncbi:aminoglycoside phosphotransferase [Streptomyces sp. NPDC006733]|uniref:aminoglycoside phosphotransferase n=1 Tax=Streptomyces sp. NPDC006733 TaxID=3155460 RepID=UPI0033C0EF41
MSELPNRATPSRAVLDAFGVTGTPVPLAGGQGQSVLVGGWVFKPAEGDADEIEWAAALSERLRAGAGFRVPPPLRALDGRCAVGGWAAGRFLGGEPGPRGRWAEVLAAGRAFHAALRQEPRPDFLGRRTHPWAVADRVAWGEQHVEVIDDLAEPYSALLELRRPVRQDAAQLIHGDLTGNVLFTADDAPAVIDFSPYWRPAAFAEAIVIADGLLWFDLPPGLLRSGDDHPDWQQLLIRALIFRLVAHSENAGPSGRAQPGEPERCRRATGIVMRGTVQRTTVPAEDRPTPSVEPWCPRGDLNPHAR